MQTIELLQSDIKARISNEQLSRKRIISAEAALKTMMRRKIISLASL